MDFENYLVDTNTSGICYFIFTLSHVSVVVSMWIVTFVQPPLSDSLPVEIASKYLPGYFFVH